MNLIKKLIFLGVLALSSLNIGCTTPIKNPYHRQGIKLVLSWEQLNQNHPRSLEEIAEYIKSCIDYCPDTENGKITDYWQSAKTTADRTEGDCEDISTLALYLGEKIGYEPELLILEKKGSNHAIALFKDKKSKEVKYGFIDYWNLIKPQYSSIQDLVNIINKKNQEETDLVNEINKKYNPKAKQIKQNHYYGFFIIPLNSLDCDWRESPENLYKHVEKLLIEKTAK